MTFYSVFQNVLWATLIYWTGGIGLFITRYFKNNWSGAAWTYIPVFWCPIILSWPVSLTVLFGGLDN
jgi:hypothetical protein